MEENVSKTGVFPVGKKFEAYVEGELIGSSYVQRSAEVMVEKKLGTYVDPRVRRRKDNQSCPQKNAPKFGIDERFDFLEKAVSMVADGNQASVIVSGSGGLGKTYTVRKTLESYGYKDMTLSDDGPYDIENSFFIIKGFSTAKKFYRTLYENNGGIIVLDDTRNIFKDKNAVDILKACLDSYDKRIVSWGSETRGDDDLPSCFEFTGRIIFITNLEPHEIDQAVRSRSLMIDVTMTLQETVDRMRTIAKVKTFLPEYSSTIKEDSVNFIDRIKHQAKELSLRTLITVCKIRYEFPNEWEDMATYVVCK